MYGNGTWGALPIIPPSLWNSSGSNVYYLGNVGIGTNTPTYPLDVIGDARISNNLYVGGGIIITDKVNAASEVYTGKVMTQKIIADSIIMDSTKAVYGITNFKDDVKLQNKLSVNGNATINGTATVNGDFKTMGSLIFAGDKMIRYNPASGGRSPSYSIGPGGPLTPLPPCFSPVADTWDFSGLYHSSTLASASDMYMGCEGANPIIESNSPGGRLLINSICGNGVDICTGVNGGPISLSSGINGGNVNICSGSEGNVILANSLGTRVGVATDYPLAKLDVQNNDPTLPTMTVSKVEPGRIRKLIFEPKLRNGDYNYLTQAGDLGIIWSDGLAPGSTPEATGFVLAPWGGVGTAYPFPGLRMTKQGFIGIGTPFPEAMVDIQNGEYIGGPGVRNPIGLKVTSTYTPNPQLGVGILCEVGDDNSKTFSSGITNGTDYDESFVVFGDGHVFARDIKVTIQTPFVHPDYVFEKNYKLKTLEELDSFIKQNGHLPEVPSAGDVKKNNGISLGEMSERQLLKIEELTLYLIEMHKKLNDLTNTVQSQQNEIQILKNK